MTTCNESSEDMRVGIYALSVEQCSQKNNIPSREEIE